jgi:tetratricopeptide (TPR) repeat protein
MRRFLLPGVPFAVSLALSFSTMGSHVYWQDSGFFLVAVKELGILYPPGFALYVLLCKAWTLAFRFLDFTYAVHLFSAVCSAAAAGTLALAARDLLRTKGPLFRTVEIEAAPASWIGASVGCLAASGFTFWAAAILAKDYAFYYLILTLLLWRMIRADEDRRPRDFSIVAALIGLAWQAHPSATNAGLALLLFVAFHRGVIGGKGIAWRTALAALGAIGPILLLPLFKRAGSALRFGDPGSWGGFWEYVFGARFTGERSNFGLDGTRVASIGRYFWEEFLGIGILLVGAGALRLWRSNRRLLIGILAWIVPVIAITVLFKLEGQHDFWIVAAWIPLWLVAAVGLSAIRRVREAAAVAALAGTIWAVAANRPDLDQRNYTLAETTGLALLEQLEPNSRLFVWSDDGASTTLYLQLVRGVRRDVRLVAPGSTREGGAPAGAGDYAETGASWTRVGVPETQLRAFGPLVTVKGEPLKPWRAPMPAEELPRLFRRARGQFVDRSEAPRIEVSPEPYERRLLRFLLLARKYEADELSRKSEYREAVRLYESILALDPSLEADPTIVQPLATLDAGLGRLSKAEALFRKSLSLKLTPAKRAATYYFLAALCGDRPEGAEWKAKALASPDLPSALRAKLEGR